MSLADRIRKFVLDREIKPARARGQPSVSVRAGDIHRAMGLNNRMPAVCSALDTKKKFQDMAAVEIIDRSLPPKGQGASVLLTFKLL